MPKRIIKVLKKMGTGLKAANTSGAMNTTEQKKKILLGEKKQPVAKKPTEKPDSEENKK